MPVLEFPPLVIETAEMIRARVDADANAGVDPNSDAFIDTTEGTPYWDLTQAPILELERMWDFASTEVPAAMFPPTAWGVYLDLHGVTLNLPRKDSAKATGSVQFTGVPGTVIPTGSVVATVTDDPTADPLEFRTMAQTSVAASPGPTGLGVTNTPTGGSLLAGTYFYVVTAMVPDPNPNTPDIIETVMSAEVFITVTGNSNQNVLTWAATPTATGYRIYRGTVSGDERRIAEVAAVTTYTDTGAATGPAKPPTNMALVEALEAGHSWNVQAGTVTLLLTPLEGVENVTNPSAMSGGAEVETDDRYRERILLEWQRPPGAGNQADYERWARAFASVGYATIEPLWNGAGTVRVIITDDDNNPLSNTVVQSLQNDLDPIPQKGAGRAPIGALVTVATPTVLTINVSATLVLDAGYSLDGAAGTIPVRSDVVLALGEYIDVLRPTEDVVLEHAKSRVFAVIGVHDVTAFQLNGTSANVVVGPPGPVQVAALGTVTLA